MKKWQINLVNLIFCVVVFGALTFGLVRTIFAPEDINEYENRYAEKIPKFAFSSYAEGKHARRKNGKFKAFAGWLYTFIAVNLGWVLFNIYTDRIYSDVPCGPLVRRA